MRLIALIAMSAAALAAAGGTLIYRGETSVGAGKLRPLYIDNPAQPVNLLCRYTVLDDGANVRAVLLSPHELRKWVAGEPHTALAETDYAESASMSEQLVPGKPYVLVLDNRKQTNGPLRVHLTVELVDPGTARRPEPARANTLVWGSVLGSGAIALWASLRLRDAWATRRTPESHEPSE